MLRYLINMECTSEKINRNIGTIKLIAIEIMEEITIKNINVNINNNSIIILALII